MANNITISKTELLYDPLFDKKPDLKMKGKKIRYSKLPKGDKMQRR